MDRRVDPTDESRHDPTADLLWSESHYLDWFHQDGTLGGYLRVAVLPNLGRTWYWACLVGNDRPLVTVIDHEIPLPSNPNGLELRADGIWADHVVETPLEHFSANLEAFALQMDDPADVYADGWGERVPFGFELEWETDRAAYQWPEIQPRYEIPCRVHGRVLVGDEELEIDGWGQRDHSWGVRDWWAQSWCWSAGRLDDGTRWHTTGAVLPGSDWGVAYVLGANGDGDDAGDFVEFDEVSHATVLGAHGFPTSEELGFGGLSLRMEPEHFAPALLTHPRDARIARFPRALSRVQTADGRTGSGWVEWNQPA